MGFNPLKILKGAVSVAADVFGVDSVGDIIDAIDGNRLTPEQQSALQQHEIRLRELTLAELQTEINAKVDLMKAELAQDDKYVKRARPTGLYISYLCSLGLVAAVIAGVEIDPGAIITLLGPLMGFSGWYTYQRTQEKVAGTE